jgi:hypothetical protein
VYGGIFGGCRGQSPFSALTKVKKQATALSHACTRLDLQEQDEEKENLRHSFT